VWLTTPLTRDVRARTAGRRRPRGRAGGYRRRREVQLLEDARHVLLDAAVGQEHARGDRRVRQPFGHQLEHFPFAGAQLADRVVAAPPAYKLRDHVGIECGATTPSAGLPCGDRPGHRAPAQRVPARLTAVDSSPRRPLPGSRAGGSASRSRTPASSDRIPRSGILVVRRAS
jgi:hypothetical protein